MVPLATKALSKGNGMSRKDTERLREYLEQVVVDPQVMHEHLAWLEKLPPEWTEREWVTKGDVEQLIQKGLAGLDFNFLARLALSPEGIARGLPGRTGMHRGASFGQLGCLGWRSRASR
jgi:hypothetical protein